MPAKELDAKTARRRDELVDERLKLEKKHKPDFDRMDQIDTELKQIATLLGRSFREERLKIGTVSVSGRKGEEFDGDFPEVDVRKLQALPEAERAKLYDGGLIVTRSKWSRPFNGRVEVKLF